MSEVPLYSDLVPPEGEADPLPYRGTSLIRNYPLLGPYSRTIPRALWRS